MMFNLDVVVSSRSAQVSLTTILSLALGMLCEEAGLTVASVTDLLGLLLCEPFAKDGSVCDSWSRLPRMHSSRMSRSSRTLPDLAAREQPCAVPKWRGATLPASNLVLL